jgi:hypothetical protein
VETKKIAVKNVKIMHDNWKEKGRRWGRRGKEGGKSELF